MRIGFIGAGRMGGPMVGRLVDTGHEVRALARTAEKRSAVGQLGATAVSEAAEAAAAADAPVSGGPHDAAAGNLTLFVGGSDDTVAGLRPVLGCYADPVLHVGPIGAGQKVKLVNNALFAAQIGLLAESVQLGTRLGVQESILLTALPHGSAASRVLSIVAARGSVRSFVETVGDFVGKDVAVVRTITAELGSDLGLLDGVIDPVVPLRPGTRYR